MTKLQLTVHADTLVARGAYDLYGQQQVTQWLGGRSALTVEQVLAIPAPAPILFWAVLREHLVGGAVLHVLAHDVAAEFLRRQHARGTYVDFRSDRALAGKRGWLDGHLSAGEARVHLETARRVATDVADHEDPHVWAAARIVVQALNRVANDAVTQTYYSFLDTFGERDDHRWLVDCARRRLGE